MVPCVAQQTVEFGIFQNDVIGLTEAQRTSEELFIGFEVVAEPAPEYKNFTFPRYQNYYGKCQLMSGAFVVENIQLQHLNQELHYSFEHSYGIIDTVQCGFKTYGSLDVPPVTIVPFLVLGRRNITSLRFKLRDGVLANITFKWNDFQSRCDDEIKPAPAGQGDPPGPNNSGYNPGGRPGGQGGDPLDNSPNDGQTESTGQIPPPRPGGVAPGATWKVVVTGLNNPPDCSPITGTYNSGVTDSTAQFAAVIIGDPAGGTGCGGSVKQLSASSNGVHLTNSDAVRAINMTIVSISYY